MEQPLIVILVWDGIIQRVVSEQRGLVYRVINLDRDPACGSLFYDEEAEQVLGIEAYTAFAIDPGEPEE